jgi:glycosyltransferase involved in cell wall biosynthesis
MEIAQSVPRSNAITFVVFTYNEEKRIEWAIKNFLPWGKVLIVDNYSEDRTVEIARSYGCDVLLNKNQGWVEDAITTSRVKASVQTEWIYWGFADELVGVESLAEIVKTVESGRYSIVNVARKNYFYGKFCHDAFADRSNRIFKKDAIDFSENTIHRFGTVTVPDSQICYLNMRHYFVHHFNSYNARTYLRTMDRYSDIEAESASSRQRHPPASPSAVAVVAGSFKIFVKNYLWGGGYKAGAAGLFVVLAVIYYRWLVNLKIYEGQHALDVAGIEKLNDDVRTKILLGGDYSRRGNQEYAE